jgi:hypothetical protein
MYEEEAISCCLLLSSFSPFSNQYFLFHRVLFISYSSSLFFLSHSFFPPPRPSPFLLLFFLSVSFSFSSYFLLFFNIFLLILVLFLCFYSLSFILFNDLTCTAVASGYERVKIKCKRTFVNFCGHCVLKTLVACSVFVAIVMTTVHYVW